MSTCSKFFVCCGLMFCLWNTSWAQQLTRSPFSRYGIGDVLNNSTTRNEAMGGIGIASNNYFSVNRLNPASYGDLVFTTMDVSGFGQFSTLRSNVSTEEEASAGFQNIFFGFPANSKLAFAFGFSPYSVVGYDVTSASEIPYRDTVQLSTISYTGDGGINQAFLGAAVKLLDQKLRIGANLAYSFGNTRYKSLSFNSNAGLGGLTVDLTEENFVGGFSTQIGFIYQDTLVQKAGADDILFRFGATTDYNFDLTGDQQVVLNTSGGGNRLYFRYDHSTRGLDCTSYTIWVGSKFQSNWEMEPGSRYPISGLEQF